MRVLASTHYVRQHQQTNLLRSDVGVLPERSAALCTTARGSCAYGNAVLTPSEIKARGGARGAAEPGWYGFGCQLLL